MKVRCEICPHHCHIEEGQIGFCNARSNISGEITCINYGRVTSLALDPIEKKPLYHFMPGSRVLSVGSFGCNLRCPFCQNCDISMADSKSAEVAEIVPEELAAKAAELRLSGNIGIAYTYNEPLIGYEFVRDTARLVREAGLKNVVVSNGYICQEPLRALLPLIDAMNIDLKGFTEDYYRKLRGDLKTVQESIALAHEYCHVEVTTLIVPGENDSEAELTALAKWLSAISPDIPLHLSRFFPRFQYKDRRPTPPETLYRLGDIAKQHLQHVHLGNI
jgi:pyruvate formate lyase activating enzyme